MNSVNEIRNKMGAKGLYDGESDLNPIFDLVMNGDHYTEWGWKNDD